MIEGYSGGEKPDGMKERDLTQSGTRSCRGWTVEAFPEFGGFGLHRACKLKRFYLRQAYQDRRSWTTVSRWKVCGKRSARVMEWIEYPEAIRTRKSRARVAGSQET